VHGYLFRISGYSVGSGDSSLHQSTHVPMVGIERTSLAPLLIACRDKDDAYDFTRRSRHWLGSDLPPHGDWSRGAECQERDPWRSGLPLTLSNARQRCVFLGPSWFTLALVFRQVQISLLIPSQFLWISMCAKLALWWQPGYPWDSVFSANNELPRLISFINVLDLALSD